MPVTFTEDLHHLDAMFDALDYLSHSAVGVGIPAENDHHSGPFSASELLYLHERGCPVNNIPPRPVMDPALSVPEVQTDMAEALLDALDSALQGDQDGTEAGLVKAGQIGTDALKNYILDGNHLALNAPITIHGGWMRNHVTGQLFYVHGKGPLPPLLATGELVNSFGYKIKERS